MKVRQRGGLQLLPWWLPLLIGIGLLAFLWQGPVMGQEIKALKCGSMIGAEKDQCLAVKYCRDNECRARVLASMNPTATLACLRFKHEDYRPYLDQNLKDSDWTVCTIAMKRFAERFNPDTPEVF